MTFRMYTIMRISESRKSDEKNAGDACVLFLQFVKYHHQMQAGCGSFLKENEGPLANISKIWKGGLLWTDTA